MADVDHRVHILEVTVRKLEKDLADLTKAYKKLDKDVRSSVSIRGVRNG